MYFISFVSFGSFFNSFFFLSSEIANLFMHIFFPQWLL